LLFILHQAYEHAFKEKIQENAWKKAGFGKTYQETKDLQKKLVQDRASIMPKFLKQFKKHAKEQDNYSEKMEEAIENDTANLQCTDPQRQYRQDMQAEADMSFMITTINKYILMQEEHEIEQQCAIYGLGFACQSAHRNFDRHGGCSFVIIEFFTS
jgi:hypothetical protein